MIPYTLIDTASDRGTTLRLYQRGEEFSIRVDRQGELMNSLAHNSEDVLAELACERIVGRECPHLLVGGLGMGFTLRAALSRAGPSARVMVAELVPAVVRWNREHLGKVAGFPLDDERVQVVEQDVGKVMREHKKSFDAIMLDVDNGPDGFTREDNDALYGLHGLNHAYEALRPGGVLTVWSAAPDMKFTQRMMKVGFDVEQRRVRAHAGQRSVRHTIWIGVRLAG
ncbi:MAG: MnmC family methyltransferase [Mariprofundaceae bacterium]